MSQKSLSIFACYASFSQKFRHVNPLPGSSKKTAMPPDKLLTVVDPSNPHFKVATEKG